MFCKDVNTPLHYISIVAISLFVVNFDYILACIEAIVIKNKGFFLASSPRKPERISLNSIRNMRVRKASMFSFTES